MSNSICVCYFYPWLCLLLLRIFYVLFIMNLYKQTVVEAWNKSLLMLFCVCIMVKQVFCWFLYTKKKVRITNNNHVRDFTNFRFNKKNAQTKQALKERSQIMHVVCWNLNGEVSINYQVLFGYLIFRGLCLNFVHLDSDITKVLLLNVV